MVDRSLWFESHLFADARGRRARRECERLGPRVHERILAAGDRLAAASPAVAQQYYRIAAAAWLTFGAEGFGAWVELGAGVLAGGPAQRDAALAYFSVPAKTLGRAGLQRLRAWCALGMQVAALSRRLSVTFLESTAPLVGTVAPEVLAEWARHGLRLHGLAGWQGEFLARAYFAGAGRVLPSLDAAEFAAWADLGVTLRPALGEELFFRDLPAGLEKMSPADRQVVFATTMDLAAADPLAAATFYSKLPGAVARLHPAVRRQLLSAFRLAGAAATHALMDVVPVAGALVQGIPYLYRPRALALLHAVAQEFPRGAMALLRSLPVAYEEVRHAAVEHWVHRGLAIAADNPEAGLAYFALQSRTSDQVLHATATAATLTDMQGLLRKYVQMLSGQPVTIRDADAAQVLRPPLEEFPLENEIALPARIDVFATHEDNCRLYRMVAAHVAGRRECATYSLTLPAGVESLPAYLRAPDQPDLLEELFLVAEGYRVAVALGRVYPGLAREQAEVAAHFLARCEAATAPSRSVLLDAMLAALVTGARPTPLPPWLRSLAGLVGPCVAPLAAPDASVDDALRIAHALALHLVQSATGVRAALLGPTSRAQESMDFLMGAYMDDDSAFLAGDAAEAADDTPPADLPAESARVELDELTEATEGVAMPLSAEQLQQLIDAGADLRLQQARGDNDESLGLYITDLLGKLPPDDIDALRRMLQDSAGADRPPPRRWLERGGAGAAFYYDEWDYHIGDYRPRWCRLRELAVAGDAGEFFNRALDDYATLLPEVRRQFQRIRPEMYRTVKGLEDGEDFDLNAAISARVDLRAKRAPSPRLYVARMREERNVATVFLIDMSASTDEPIQKPAPLDDGDAAGSVGTTAHRDAAPAKPARRIIDVTKEALVIMSAALAEIGDAYAIYGFSGHGRDNVEFYLVKSFSEPLSATVKGRIGAIEPKSSTRMGTALRHATEKLAGISARSRYVILLSDGFPQDFDYGQDRRSNVYGLRDTSAALREAEAAGITPFCITVDKAGHDYLRTMCDPSRYLVIEDISALPRELPKIYQRVVTG
ncbi:MAG: hypothetical protein H6Q33_1970 [Deltaproteobacteria bacterium]|nr:hypothetical protein [Deltaproteobacteria bacterium]